MGSGLLWGWGWLAGVGVIIILGLFLLPWFFFLLNLQTLLNHVSPANRKMSPGLVWLNFIPVFHLGWFIYTVIKVKDSVLAEFQAREWFVDGDLGYNVGLTAGILWVASFFIGWIPFIGWVLPLAGVVCWIIYWLKTSDLRGRLDAGPAWNRGPYTPRYPPAYPPYEGRYGPLYGPPGAGSSPGAAGRAAGRAEGQSFEPPGEAEAEAKPRENEGEGVSCTACGAQHDPEDRFCRKCGSRLY